MIGFSVGVFEGSEVSPLLTRKDIALVSLGPTCDRVSVWHVASDGWRGPLIEHLLTGPLRAALPVRLVQVGLGRQILKEGEPAVAEFLVATRPETVVHRQYALLIEVRGCRIVLLTDVDGEAVDLLVTGDQTRDKTLDLARFSWDHLIEDRSVVDPRAGTG